MSWQVKTQHVEADLGRHYAILHDPQTGAEHHLVIYVGHVSCPLCGHVKPLDAVEQIDCREIIKQEMAALEASHKQAKEHARKNNLPLVRADGSRI